MSAHDEVCHELQSRGLSRLVPYLPRLLHPSIRILATAAVFTSWEDHLQHADPTPIGISKIGGWPDIWPGFQWPQLSDLALPFLAQFRMEDIAPYDEEKLLPTQGMMLVFFDAMAHFQDEKAMQVLYFDGDLATLSRADIPDNATRWDMDIGGEVVYEAPQLLRFCRDWQLADDDNIEYQSIDQSLVAIGEPLLSESENEGYWRFSLDWNKKRCDAIYKRELKRSLRGQEQPNHQLLGVPYAGNFDGRLEISDESFASEWRLLFQFSSDDGLDWGNCCCCSFFIESDALARRDFSNIQVTCDG
ncbi:DUF1963 domain-containing protein [bacterium]|nr:MAG: DUF1963 domain-containing protein [bacterium]